MWYARDLNYILLNLVRAVASLSSAAARRPVRRYTYACGLVGIAAETRLKLIFS